MGVVRITEHPASRDVLFVGEGLCALPKRMFYAERTFQTAENNNPCHLDCSEAEWRDLSASVEMTGGKCVSHNVSTK